VTFSQISRFLLFFLIVVIFVFDQFLLLFSTTHLRVHSFPPHNNPSRGSSHSIPPFYSSPLFLVNWEELQEFLLIIGTTGISAHNWKLGGTTGIPIYGFAHLRYFINVNTTATLLHICFLNNFFFE